MTAFDGVASYRVMEGEPLTRKAPEADESLATDDLIGIKAPEGYLNGRCRREAVGAVQRVGGTSVVRPREDR